MKNLETISGIVFAFVICFLGRSIISLLLKGNKTEECILLILLIWLICWLFDKIYNKK